MRYVLVGKNLADAFLLAQRSNPTRDQLYGKGTAYFEWRTACADELVKLGLSTDQAAKEVANDVLLKEMFSRGVSAIRVAQDIEWCLTTPPEP
jgi:hypothetical protein